MKSDISTSFLLLTLTIIFTLGLTFASIEIPKIADNIINQNVDFVNVYTGGGDLQDIKTELFIRHFHLRTIGYLCFFGIILIIAIGFLTEKSGLTSLGAVVLFLPVFGHFAATMFFLGGLGFLRLLWLPGLEVSFNIMNLGDAVFIPYRIFIDGFNLLGINLNFALPYILIVFGLLIFGFGTLVWLHTYFKKFGIAKFWIYKFSRHPQYLGWIIWSYGIMFLPGANLKQYVELSNSLPWLISTIIIIGVAMLEEIKMRDKYGPEYDLYRKESFFMIPFPKYICRVVSAPFRVFFNKNYPSNKKEIITVLVFYFSLIVFITFILNSSAKMVAPGKWIFENEEKRTTQQLAENFITTLERRDKYRISVLLRSKGDSSISYFISYLNHSDPIIREFSADALGILTPEKAIDPLITLLNDNNWRVKRSAINSLGNFNSKKSIESLLLLMENDILLKPAAFALSKSCNEQALKVLVEKVEEGVISPTISLIDCLAKFHSPETFDVLGEFSKNKDANIRQAAVIGLMKTNSQEALPHLEKAIDDEDWEVRLYAEEAITYILNHN